MMKGILIAVSIFVAVGGEYLYHQADDPLSLMDNLGEYDQVDDEAEIAREAYIYFYPILVDMYSSYNVGIWPHTSEYFSINNFVHSYIVEWSNSSATDPCLDILYSRAYLDLENPLVLNIPDIPQKRYYGFVIKDGYDVNIKIISPRTLGGSLGGSWAADQYVIVGPGFRGSLPSYFDDDHIIRSLTRFSFIVVRTQIYDLDDAPNVAAIQSGYTLAPLAGNEPQKTNMPIFPFMNKDVVHKPDPEAQLFFSYANFITNYMEIEDCESDLFKRFAKIDVGPSKEFIGQEMSQQMYRNIQDGVTSSSMILEGIPPDTIDVNSWRRLYTSKAGRYDYLDRAFRAKKGGIFISDPEEVAYYQGLRDVDGDPLDSIKYDYTLTFSPGQLPPVVEEYGGFWSITAYLASAALIHNPIDRYLINGVNTPGLVYDANGALTLYIQKTRPDSDAKAANWLPTPDPEFGGYETGGFQFMLRLYMSEDLDYLPPDIVKGGPATS